MILLGQDNYQLIAPSKIIKGPKNCPVMTKTELGWLVHGPLYPYRHREQMETVHYHQEPQPPIEDMQTLMHNYFAIEALGVRAPPPLQSCEDKRATELLAKTTSRIDGRFQTGLLWKEENVQLPESRVAATKRLRSIEKRMDRDRKFAEDYSSKMEHFFKQNYAKAVTEEELAIGGSRLWFLPHFAVFNPKKPGKLRLVFDCAAKSQGTSLNDVLITGPDYLTSLPKNLFNFRSRPIALTGDIKEMYPQIKIIPEDQFSQCFLWRGMDRESEPKIFKITSMMFGTKSSPCSAQYIKNVNAQEFSNRFPDAANAIINYHYMDNYLDSFSTVSEAKSRYEEVFKIHQQGGFQMCGWSSNSKELISHIPPELTTLDKKDWSIDTEIPAERILGMVWNPNVDTFTYDLSFYKVRPEILSQAEVPTKRDVCKVVMAIFDPLGLVSHLTIPGKMVLQEIWRSKTDWDEPIKPELAVQWREFMKNLQKIAKISIPRCYLENTATLTNFHLHIFSDASAKAYATVAYL
ncbi:unnamed protein product, partial [Allacma fusca]